MAACIINIQIKKQGSFYMETVKIQMDLPKDVLLAANILETNAATEIKKYLAVSLFKKRILSFGKARALSGMDKMEFMMFAGSKGISLNYDADDYSEDLEIIKGVDL